MSSSDDTSAVRRLGVRADDIGGLGRLDDRPTLAQLTPLSGLVVRMGAVAAGPVVVFAETYWSWLGVCGTIE